ncbi:hypothetical protein [Rickettsia endosymbiont of Ceutorhynchus obstrictus]|uniref:hypothetical protein n=1 Tax=Rickettsia endosymbiont of Ceutorhynchus obstrictus TaxID=3066249 RepID=UPI003132E10E
MPNINPLKEKPQEFELIELLFPDIAKSSIPQNPPLDYSFQARFQSFINQIPSYLHSSIKEGFFPHFFLGSFSTLLDTRLGVQKIGITSLYFRFDSAKTLKVVVEIEKKVNVFIFTEEGNKKYTSEQLRTRKLEFTTDELDEINNLRANNKQSKLKEKDIKIQLIKINKSTGENKITVEIDNNIPIKHDAGPAPVKFPFQKITKKRAGDDYLENDIAKLASSDTDQVRNIFEKILTHIKDTHTALSLSKDVYGSQAREADHHGFVAGVFDNFRYRENTRIYLEQFAGRGYADIILLVRGPDRATNSIPIIIELKAGITGQIGSSDALKQAKDYTKGFQPNTMRILTIPDNILCAGMNLDSTASSFIQMELVKRDVEITPLVQGILDSTREWEVRDQITREKDKSVFQDKIKEYLENTYHTFPGTGEKSENHYFSRFLLGQSILLEDDKYTKHIFIYNKDDIVATEELKVLDSQATRVQPGRIAKDKTKDSQQTDLKGDKSHAITTVLFIPSSQKDSVILLNIIETNRDVQLKKIPLNQALIGDRKIIQLDLHFRIDKKQFEEYCNIKIIDLYPSLKSYNDAYNEESKGDFTKITYPDKLKEKFVDALNSQLQANISSDKYNNLLKKIGEGINPIKSFISKEAHFQAILHGAFSHYSDIKLAGEEKTRELVLTEFQTGAGGRIDMLIQGIGASVQGTKEYTPVGLELKYDDSIKLTHTQENNLLKITDIAEKIQKEQEFLNDKGKKVVKNLVDEQVNRYSQGAALKAITDSDKIVIMGAVFNAQARNADSLLLTSDSFTSAIVVHSSTTVADPNVVAGLSKLCLGAGRTKRSINDCLYSWDDVDNFNVNKKAPRDLDQIMIDSKKFLEYTKNIQDNNKNSQLLELAKERIAAGDNNINIIGEYKYLLNDVIQDGGYNSYIQNERIKDLSHDFSKSDAPKINPKLKQGLLNAAGKVQLIRGIHSTIATCQDGSEGYCALSVTGLSYSFLSQPIEHIMVKITPKIVNTAANTAGKFVPRVLGYNTKFVIQIGGMKYGAKIAKGTAGALAGVFDIIDIAMSSNTLVQCANKKGSNDPCSDKDIRDNIASITFSSVSFFSGIGLTVAGAGPLAIGVGFGLMVGYGIYSGISNIIEYEEKYDTTHSENWSIFWRTMLLQDMAQDIKNLKFRTEAVNNIVQNAWKTLSASPNDVVAYATGLGKIEYQPKNCKNKEVCHAYYIAISCHTISYCDYISTISGSSATIHMHEKNANTKHLSRVLPHPIQNSTMICLPEITDADYEKGVTKSVPTAVHHCDNAVVMVHNQRKASKNNDQWIIYDLRYINTGTIIGSDKLHNVFLLSEGNTKILGGNDTTNQFIFISDKFLGPLSLGSNSTNILSTEQLTNEVTDFKITNTYSLNTGFSQVILNDRSFAVHYFRYDDARLHYIGRKNKVDNIVCEPFHLTNIHYSGEYHIPAPHIFIDSGGGYSHGKEDLITGCNKVNIYPYTKVAGYYSTYTFFVKTQGYENQVSSSTINVHGNGTIIFSKISLLKDCDQITYSPINNTISFRIPLSQNGTFTLDVKNYLDRNNNTNFVLIDKHGSNIVPKLDSNSTIVSKFELHAGHSLDNLSIAKDYYRNISYTEKDYKIFGVISSALENDHKVSYKMVIGSSGVDVINLDKQTVFAEGGEGQDVYIASNAPGETAVNIDNRSEDKKLDILSVQSIDDVSLEQKDDNLSLLIEKKVNHTTTERDNIIIENYFLGNEYKHLILVDQSKNSFIPFDEDVRLVPFYHASSNRNVFILPVSIKQVVVDSNLENIEFCRNNNDLLLLEKDIGENPNPLVVILKDFYSDTLKWQDFKLYSYSNGSINYKYSTNLLQEYPKALDYKKYNYEKIVKEYVVDFGKSLEINHNQKLVNNTLISIESDAQRIGVMLLKNVLPEQIKVHIIDQDLIFTDKNSNNFIKIKNWCINENYRISTLEFDLGLDPIKIQRLDKNNCSTSYLENNISNASQLYKLNKELESVIDYDIEHVLRCVMSINSFDITEAYAILGFTSVQDEINFIEDCDFKEFTRLKSHINNSLLSKYQDKLLYNVQLQNYSLDKTTQYSNIINQQLFPDNVVNRIMKTINHVQNPVEYVKNRDGYNITINKVEDNTIIDLCSLSKQIKESLYKELQSEIVESGNDILMKLFYYKDGGRVSPLTNGEIYLFPPDKNYIATIKLKEALNQDWYKRLEIYLNDIAIRISYNSEGLFFVQVPLIMNANKNVIIITEKEIEWKMQWTMLQTAQNSIIDYVSNSSTENSVIYDRYRREIAEGNETENISDHVISNAASSMLSPINNMINWLKSKSTGILLSVLNPINKINWFTAKNIKTASIDAEQTADSSTNSTTKNSASIK